MCVFSLVVDCQRCHREKCFQKNVKKCLSSLNLLRLLIICQHTIQSLVDLNYRVFHKVFLQVIHTFLKDIIKEQSVTAISARNDSLKTPCLQFSSVQFIYIPEVSTRLSAGHKNDLKTIRLPFSSKVNDEIMGFSGAATLVVLFPPSFKEKNRL